MPVTKFFDMGICEIQCPNGFKTSHVLMTMDDGFITARFAELSFINQLLIFLITRSAVGKTHLVQGRVTQHSNGKEFNVSVPEGSPSRVMG